MNVDYFYSLSQRQLWNIIQGYSKKQNELSKERWIIARKIIFHLTILHTDKIKKETDIFMFKNEEEVLKKISAEEEILLLKHIEKSKLFWNDYDNKKNKA